MRKVLTACILICAGFFAGYLIGQARPGRQGHAAVSSAVIKAGPNVSPKVGPQDISVQKRAFAGIMQSYAEQVQGLRLELDNLAKASAYLRDRTADGTGARSLEESLVHEARYRESLGAMLTVATRLVLVLEQALQYAKEYVGFLESR